MKPLTVDGLQIIKRGLTIPMVVQRVPTSDTTFENHYPGRGAGTKGGKDKFIEELMSWLVTGNPRSTKHLLAEEFANKLVESNGDPRHAIRELCKWDIEQVKSDPATLIRLFVIALARNHKGALNAVREEYKEVTEHGRHAYEQILTRWGATLRKPFTPELVANLFMAIAEGLTLQWLVDPDSVPDSLFGDAVVVFTAGVVDMGQRQEHIDDMAAVSFANEVMRDFRISKREGEIENPRKVILEAAATEFAQRGFFATGLTHVAANAGVQLTTLKRLFPHTVDIVVGGLKPAFEQLKVSVADNKTFNMSAEEVLGRFLKDLAALLIDNRAMADAFLGITTNYGMHAPEMERVKRALDFPSLITPTIEAGQQAGIFSAALEAPEVAAMLVDSLLQRCSTRRNHTVEEIVREISALFLYGLLARK